MSERTAPIDVEIDVETQGSGVAWAAVIAGALVATAITLALIVLGTGLGFSIVSPWAEESASVTTVAISTVVWLIVMQWVSAGFGGYLTGRLRKRWVSVHTDEAFFRDTAHGFLTWALATVIVATLAASAASSLVGAGAQATATLVGGAAQGAASVAQSATDPTRYFVDTLFRPAETNTESNAAVEPAPAAAPEQTAPGGEPGAASAPAQSPPVSTQSPRTSPRAGTSANTGATRNGEEVRAETMQILVRGMTADEFPAEDRQYLARLVASETDMSQREAEARVESVLQGLSDAKAEAQRIAEEARENTVTMAIVTFLSLLIGAFIASVAAALGGRHRDAHDLKMVVPRY